MSAVKPQFTRQTSMFRILAALALSAGCPLQAANDSTAAPLTPEQAVGSFELAPGLEIELVAAEPLTASPAAMAFDEHGRLFVAENRGYPRTSDPPQGVVAMLEDTDADGRMDKRTVFADGLTFPNGVMPWRGGLFVTCAPDVLYFKDTDGDGQADERRVILTGFDTKGSTQLRVNAPILGPDGWVWLASGLSGGKISNPEHPEYPALDLKTDLRFDPVSGRFEAVDGRSQYGHSFDYLGNRFICMNRVQVQHVVLSSAHLRRNPHLAFSETVQNCPELVPNPLLRGGGGAARIFPISKNITTADSHAGTFSAACAVMIWSNFSFLGRGSYGPPPSHLALSCDPTGNLVHADELRWRGPTFSAAPAFEGRELLASRDDWFRPVFLAGGPDGALYVCDMYRKVIEHPDYLPEEIRKRTDFESGKEMGRIWRVRSSREPRIEPLRQFPSEAQALGTLLSGDHAWRRDTSFRLLLEKRAAGEDVAIAPTTPSQATSRSWLLRRNRLMPLTDAELDKICAERDPGGLEFALQLVAEDVNTGRRDVSHLARLLPRLMKAPDALRDVYAFWASGNSAYAALITALGAVRDDSLAVPLLVRLGTPQEGVDRWGAAAIVASSAGRELAVLREVAGSRDKRPYLDKRHKTLVALLAETLGRAERASGANSLEAILAGMHRADFKGRAFAASAYARGRQLAFDPAMAEVGTLVRHASNLLLRADDADEDLAPALSVLAHTPWEWGGGQLLQFASHGEHAALEALAGWDKPEIPRALLASPVFRSGPGKLREEMLAICLSRASYCSAVLDAVESGAMPASLVPASRRPLFLKHSDPAIRARAEKAFVTVTGDRREALEKAKAALALTPNANAGRETFRKLCASCHRLDREGSAVGPDLFDIRNQPKESILLHIVAPDHEIAPGFAACSVETKNGRSLGGVLASETPESITVRQPGGVEETILRAEIANLTALQNSLMPAGLEATMTPQELADLLAYLKGEAP